MELSSEERELFVEIGYHIARVMWQNLGRSDPTYQTEMEHLFLSVYEHGCAIMVDLDVFVPTKPCHYRFAMPLENVRDHLQTISPSTSYSLDQLIGKFLWATAGYQGDVSDEKKPFEVPGYLQQAMWAFVKLGYATREPGGFLWTEKIAPIMIAEYLWMSDGRSITTLEQEEADDLTERIWSAVPQWRRHLLARWIIGKSELDLIAYIFRRWDGSALRFFEVPKSKRGQLPSECVVVVREIADRLLTIRKDHPF